MMIAKSYEYVKNPFAEPELLELLFLIFNFAASVPVWVCVSLFAIYHLYLVGNNTTTIERWEKDKVATLVRRGKLAEIKYPYVSLGACLRADLRTLASSATCALSSVTTPFSGFGPRACPARA